MEFLLCLGGIAVFWLVVMPALGVSGRESDAEDIASALDRLTRP